MEQKTEPSQAVDARAEQVSRLLTIGGMMSNVMFNLAQRDNPDAKQFKELCAKWDAAAHDAIDLRAALKAQPAPTEAQGEDSARLDAERLPSMNPACGCEACNPQMIGWMMFICKLCGDKRCPHVANHVNPCQGRARASAETGGMKS